MNLGVRTCFTLLHLGKHPWDSIHFCSLFDEIAAITRWVEVEGSFRHLVFLHTIMVESTTCCRWTLRNRLQCRTTDLDICIIHQMLQTGSKRYDHSGSKNYTAQEHHLHYLLRLS